MHLLYFALIGLAAGWLAGQLFKGSDFGLVGDLVVGVIGAFFGGLLFSIIGLTAYGLVADLIVATVGAIAFLYVVRFLKRKGVL